MTSALLSKLIAFFLSILIQLGLAGPVGTDHPITFKNSDEVKLSYCLLSDTHIRATASSSNRWNNFMRDVENSDEKFDALVVAGDLTNVGVNEEYGVFFDGIESTDAFDSVLIATGNHDMRFTYNINHKLINSKQREYLGIDTDKDYYSYEVNGYTFIVLGTEKAVFEKAYLSDDQLNFLDSELEKATAKSNITFVVCHQPLKDTHGLPEVWLTGDLGDQSDQVRAILSKYKNVLYINGHLHDGIYERSVEKLSDNVYSLNVAAFGKDNDEGKWADLGLGYFVEVYENEMTFNARNFDKGENIDAHWTFSLGGGLELVDYQY